MSETEIGEGPLPARINDLAIDLKSLEETAHGLAVDLGGEEIPDRHHHTAGTLYTALRALRAEAWAMLRQAQEKTAGDR